MRVLEAQDRKGHPETKLLYNWGNAFIIIDKRAWMRDLPAEYKKHFRQMIKDAEWVDATWSDDKIEDGMLDSKYYTSMPLRNNASK